MSDVRTRIAFSEYYKLSSNATRACVYINTRAQHIHSFFAEYFNYVFHTNISITENLLRRLSYRTRSKVINYCANCYKWNAASRALGFKAKVAHALGGSVLPLHHIVCLTTWIWFVCSTHMVWIKALVGDRNLKMPTRWITLRSHLWSRMICVELVQRRCVCITRVLDAILCSYARRVCTLILWPHFAPVNVRHYSAHTLTRTPHS